MILLINMEVYMLRKLFPILFAVVVSFSAQGADTRISKYVDDLINKSFTVLKDTTKSMDEKIIESETLISTNMDLEWMSKFVLGKYRRALTPDEVAKFTKLYSVYVVKSYSSGVKNFKNQEIKVKSQQELTKGEYVVKTLLLRQDLDPLQIDYLARVTPSEKIKIFDVVTEGISLINSHQAEFCNILSSRTFKDLIIEIQNKIKSLENNKNDANPQ